MIKAPFLLTGAVATLVLPSFADAQSKERANRTAYGSRVGDRDLEPNNAGLSRDRRVGRRLDTRIESRLDTRINRFDLQPADEKGAYTPTLDDGTKTKPR